MKIPHRKKDLHMPLMFLIAIVLSAICFASHSSGTSTVLSKGLSLMTTPLRSATKEIYNVCSSAGNYFSDITDLKKDNAALLKENKRLKEENESFQTVKKENDSLYKFLELKKEHNDYKFTNANIVSRSNSGYTQIFTIDKGSFHGIEKNMPIISDEGALIGITYSVEPTSTRCKSILSYDVNVGVYDEETGETGILSGSFDTFKSNKCVIEGLGEETAVKEGTKIVTSGLGETYPRGLIIGTVEGFIPEKGSHTKNAVVVPDRSVIVSDSIMVITSFQRVYE